MQSTRLWAAATTLLLVAAWGCSKNDGSAGPAATATGPGAGGGSGGATTSTGGGGGEGGAGGAGCELCNCLSNDAPEVEWVRLDQELPAPQGGSLRDGIYFLTGVTLFTGAGGMTGPAGTKWKMTIEFVPPPKGPVMDVVVDRYQGMGEERYSFGYQPDDNGVIGFNSVCDSVNVPWDAYQYVDGDPPVLTLFATTQNTAFIIEQQTGTGGADGTERR
jgi:hypothetical protein